VTPDHIRHLLSAPTADLADTFEEVARRTARLVLHRALEAEVEELLASYDERQILRVRRVRVRPVRRALRRFHRIARVEVQPGATGTQDEMSGDAGLVPIELPIEVEDASDDFSWRPPAPRTDEAVRSQVGVFQAVLEAMGAAR
jgi:hypothetical protein